MPQKNYYTLIINCPESNSDAILGFLNLYLKINSLEETTLNNNSCQLKIYIEENKIPLTELCCVVHDKIKPLATEVDIKRIKYDPSIETQWKKYFKPFKISKSIVIKPSWERYKKKPGETVITIDPETAFGTGLHETTKGVIMLLESYIKKTDLKIKLLDAGTGSGILSIVASKLGVNEVTAFDNDIEAVIVANKNIKINKVTNVKILHSDFDNIRGPFNIILANIISEILIKNYNIFKSLSKPESFLILSGILVKEKKNVVNKFTKENFYELLENLDLGEWTSLVFKTKA